jgi:hypothetical protein
MSSHSMSLYIPYVFMNFDKEYIADKFSWIGDVSDIDLVLKTDGKGKQYNSVFIHLNKLNKNKSVENFIEKVTDPNQEARLYHDKPWYWVVLLNTAKKIKSGDRKPRINLGDLTSINVKTTEQNDNKYKSEQIKKDKPRSNKLNNPCYKFINNYDYDYNNNYDYDDYDYDNDNYDNYDNDDYDNDDNNNDDNYNSDYETNARIYPEKDYEKELNEIESLINDEDMNLVSIDSRYIQVIEEENIMLRNEIAYLRSLLNMN